MKLRYYQSEAIAALYEFFRTHPDPTHNPLIALPVGTGKSVVIGGFSRGVLQHWPSQRILMLTHVKELIEQNAKALRAVWPQAPIGIYSAGLGSKVTSMPITYAGVKSVFEALHLFSRQDLILIDEAHLVSEEETSVYRKVIAYFKALNPNLRVIGFSATCYRMGLGMLTEGGLFTHIAYDATTLTAFNRLIDEGYLVNLIPMTTSMILDVSGVKRRRGDFVEKDLQRAVNREELTRQALSEVVVAAADRRHWLGFSAGVEHAQSISAMLRNEFGVSSVVVHGKMGQSERDDAIAAFKEGHARACVNANILTTGFDYPALDCIFIMRPSTSTVLHVQILGRGVRPFWGNFDPNEATTEERLAYIEASEKPNCLVLDYAGNVKRMGPLNDPKIPKMKGEGTGEVPIKVCDHCGVQNHISAFKCVYCGEEFPVNEKLQNLAGTADIIARPEPPRVETYTVDRVTYRHHVKPNALPTMQVSYHCGIQRFSEWVPFEHYHSGARGKAVHWWHERANQREPASVAEALARQGEIRVPSRIKVWINAKHPKVTGAEFDELQ